MMLEERQVKSIEDRLNSCAEVYYDFRNEEVKARNLGYCQGIAYVLGIFDYRIEWEDGKAYVVKCE